MPIELSRNAASLPIWNDPFAAHESTARRGMRFLLVLGAHVAAIVGTVELASRPEVRHAVQQIYVRMVELPPPVPEKPLTQAAKPIPVARKETVRKPEPPPPILAAANDAPAVASFVVPPQPPAPPTPPPIQIAPPAPPEPLPVVAARFDADYLHNPKPIYPAIARRLGEEGAVLLRVQVSPEGTPLAVELRKSSGYPRLDDAALEAVRRWRFVPARQGGEAVESRVAVPIVFKLEQ